MALNPTYRPVLNFAHADLYVTILSVQTGCVVATVTYSAMKMATTCSFMIGR